MAVSPNLPGLAYSIGLTTNKETGVQTDSVKISQGAKNLYSFDWLFGFTVSVVVYTVVSWVFPATESLVESTVYGDMVEGVGSDGEGDMARVVSDREKSPGDMGAVDIGSGKHHGDMVERGDGMGDVVR